MSLSFQIVFDCRDPDLLVPFWTLALAYEPEPPPEPHATWREWYASVGIPEDELGDGDCSDRLRDPAGVGPKIWFQQVPEGKVVKNRLHLDVLIAGRGVPVAERRRVVRAHADLLLSAGATELRELAEAEGHFAVTLLDPEGNEFCVT
jgi:hypothetical protein